MHLNISTVVASRQKVFSRGIPICAGVVDIIHFRKTRLICSVSYFDLGGLRALFGGAKPAKALPWRRDYASSSNLEVLLVLLAAQLYVRKKCINGNISTTSDGVFFADDKIKVQKHHAFY